MPQETPEAVWNDARAKLVSGSIEDALAKFAQCSVDKYRRDFARLGNAAVSQMMNATGPISPVVIEENSAQYRFDRTIDGVVLTFVIQFMKENGQWKIVEF
jgi:hypothetical protein